MNLYAKGYKGYNIQEKLYYYRIVRDEKYKHRPMKYGNVGERNAICLQTNNNWSYTAKRIETNQAIEILSRRNFLLLWLFLRKEPYGTKSYISNHACLQNGGKSSVQGNRERNKPKLPRT